jgi:coenzyme Q-binding protein COQ10
MYDLVADVEKYPLFLPLCESLKVKSRETAGDTTIIVATMGIGYKSIRELFTTRVVLKPKEQAIDVSYLDGPFHHLDNRWRFLDVANGSDVDFYIDYSFRSPMLALLMGALFDTAFRRFAQAFEDRAAVVYGQPSRNAPSSV